MRRRGCRMQKARETCGDDDGGPVWQMRRQQHQGHGQRCTTRHRDAARRFGMFKDFLKSVRSLAYGQLPGRLRRLLSFFSPFSFISFLSFHFPSYFLLRLLEAFSGKTQLVYFPSASFARLKRHQYWSTGSGVSHHKDALWRSP